MQRIKNLSNESSEKARNYNYSLLFVITCGAAAVLTENLVNNISPLLTLLYVTAIAIAYFHILNFNKILGVYRKFLINNKMDFLIINFLIAVVWVCTYFGNYYSSATIYNYIFFTTLGVFSRFKTPQSFIKNRVQASLGVALIIIPFILYPNQFLGIVLALIGGIFLLFYNIKTFEVMKKINITATQTLAIRFWFLLIILSLFSINKFPGHVLDVDTIAKIFILAFLNLILQIWLSQKGLYSLGVKLHGIVLSLTPLVTLILQGLILHKWFLALLTLTLISPFILNETLWDGIKQRLLSIT